MSDRPSDFLGEVVSTPAVLAERWAFAFSSGGGYPILLNSRE